ncbi:MAG: GNAT family N-acetyltransferase [Anaeromyxobacter sp.]
MPSAYRIESFEPRAAAYQAAAELLDKVWPEWPASAAFMARFDEETGPDHASRRLLARAPTVGQVVAMAEWRPHLRLDDPTQFQLSLSVDPQHRRRGLGAELWRRALAALPAGASQVEVETSEDRPEAVRFLLQRGFHERLRMQLSELELERFDPARFAGAVETAEAGGLRLRDLGEGGAEDERLLRALHALEGEAMPDAPGADGYVAAPFERWRRAYHANPDFRPELHLLALDGERVVGMTQLWASQATDAILFTGFTGVARSHRRRGIATALKVRVLERARALRTASGQAPLVRTGNAERNPMLAINLQLGFSPRPSRLVMVRDLSAAPAPGAAQGH